MVRNDPIKYEGNLGRTISPLAKEYDYRCRLTEQEIKQTVTDDEIHIIADDVYLRSMLILERLMALLYTADASTPGRLPERSNI
jgi:hypothetical protein